MSYVEIFLLPLQKKHLKRYQRLSAQMGKLMLRYGATEYREFVGDDLAHGNLPFTARVKLKPGEVVIAAVVGFKSKAQRASVNKLVMKDKTVLKMIEEMKKDPIHDPKRMSYGGFKTIVQP